MTYLCSEKAFAGPGIKPIYEFLHEKFEHLEYFASLTTEEIVKRGCEKIDVLCNKVVDFFLELYATEVGNMVIREKPFSGIFLVGNLREKLFKFYANFFSRVSNQRCKGLFDEREERPVFGKF